MTKRNPEYDFKWCPGCGDFGVKRAIEVSLQGRNAELGIPTENNVIVAGIGCSGNMVHLTDGPQPFGFHGIHGRTLPVAFGIKMGNPELNVLIVAGDGDFLSIGAEHIGPAAQRNVNVTCIIMDNAVYGLTKGQSSPTTQLGVVTPTTPGGKAEGELRPLELYLALGVQFVASSFSSKPKDMADLMRQAMDFPGFSIVHIQSPCTTYNDNYDLLRGNAKKGIEAITYDIPEDHDASSYDAALSVARSPGIPLGVVYEAPDSKPLDVRMDEVNSRLRTHDVDDLIESYVIA